MADDTAKPEEGTAAEAPPEQSPPAAGAGTEKGKKASGKPADKPEDAKTKTGTKADEPADKPRPPSSGPGGWLVIFVLLLLAGAGLYLTDTWQPVWQKLQHWTTPREQATKAPAPKPKPATPPATQPPQAAQSRPAAPQLAPESAAPMSSEEAAALLDAMQALTRQMDQFRNDQQAILAALHKQQRLNLQTRLRWILDPASRLPQIQLAWEEISLLPGLSAAQRQQAESMHALARQSVQQIRQWRARLQSIADMLKAPTHADVIPKPAHPWLAWIAGQFHLRRAASPEEARLSRLRGEVLDIERLLALETWPADQSWQLLRARLMLELRRMQPEQAPELGLPESFSDIASNTARLRDTARRWLEGGS